jgi:hypothetical protein
MKIAARLIALTLFAALASAPALAAAAERVGQFEKWEVVTFQEDGATGCYVMSRPEKEEGNYTDRDPAAVFVTHRPAQGAIGVVSVAAGYPYDTAKPVRVEIGGEVFGLFAQGESAWARDEDDPKLVAAMKRGSNMVVYGVSARGTETRDTYSLIGFTAAYDAATSACGL